MKKKPIFLVLIVFSCCFNYLVGQNKQKTVVQDYVFMPKNVNNPFTEKELSFLNEVFLDEDVNYIKSNKNASNRYKNILRNRVKILEVIHEEKIKDLPLLSSIGLIDGVKNNFNIPFNKEYFNVLKYKFNFFSKESYKVRIDHTNYVLVVHSQFKK